MKKKSVIDDPVVQEVREARAKLYREGGGTIEGYIRAVHETVKQMRMQRKPRRKSKRSV